MTKPPGEPLKVAILVCPGFAIMDVIGPHTIFGVAPNTEVHLVWKNTDQFDAIPRFPSQATVSFADCPEDLDVVVVGAVPPEVLADVEVQDFFLRHHERGAFVIGVCVGSLLLGAAGLLDGRRATTNFQNMSALDGVGATAVPGGDVVVDGRIYTAGPVTGGFEAALLVLAHLRGEAVARFVELAIEYAPKPPFGTGSPELAGPELAGQAIAAYKPFTDAVASASAKAFEARRGALAGAAA